MSPFLQAGWIARMSTAAAAPNLSGKWPNSVGAPSPNRG